MTVHRRDFADGSYGLCDDVAFTVVVHNADDSIKLSAQVSAEEFAEFITPTAAQPDSLLIWEAQEWDARFIDPLTYGA
jgi:hypothetical protein